MGLNSVFQGDFTSAGGGTGRWALILWGFGIALIFPSFLRS